jgi:hypothetical protein
VLHIKQRLLRLPPSSALPAFHVSKGKWC